MTCDMTRGCVWHDSLLNVTWLIDTFDWVASCVNCVTDLQGTSPPDTYRHTSVHLARAMTYLWNYRYRWNDSWILVTRSCDMTCWYMWHVSVIRVTWLIDTCDMSRSYVWHDLWIHVTCLLHTYGILVDIRHGQVCPQYQLTAHTHTHTHTHTLSLSISLSVSLSLMHTHTHAHIHTHIYTYMNIGWLNHEITSTQASEQLANLRPYAYIHVYMYRLTKPRDYDDTNKVDGPRTLNQAPSFEGSGFRMYVCMWMCHVTCMNAHVWHDPIQRQ